jgi:hypothetical protein
MKTRVLLLLLLTVFGARACAAQPKIQALILSGRSNHDWRTTTPQLKKLLEQTGRFDVRVNEETAACSSESLAPYQVIVVDYHGPRWAPACEKAIEDFVRGGKGLVGVHGAIYGFGKLEILGDGHRPTGTFQPPWTEYARMLGGSWPEPPQPNYHGQRHIYEVKLLPKNHPITAGLPASFRHNDELYHKITTAPGIEVLATAFDDPKMGGSGRDEPMVWTARHGSGRVFVTLMGHDLEAMSDAGFIQTFTRGTEWAASGSVAPPASKPKAISALVVTGGHEFTSGFYTLFQGYEDLHWEPAMHRRAAEGYVRDMAKKYDVVVLYDMPQEATDQQRQNLMEFVRAGKGVVMLHHAIASFQTWPQYAELVGGKYFEKQEGEHRASEYAHDQDMTIHVADPKHPVTRGVPDFDIHDEGYKYIWVSPGAHILLTTDHPKADPAIAWISPFQGTRVVSILLGHGEEAYASPSFRLLVINAIRWAAAPLSTQNRGGP